MKTKILALILPFLLISCVEVKDSNQSKKVAAPVVSPPSVEVRPLSKPHQYAVLIKGQPDMSTITRKPLNVLASEKLTTVSASNSEGEDVVDQPGRYEYSIQQGGQTFLLQVEIPQDYVVEGNMKFEQLDTNVMNENDEFKTLETSGRVFFKAGASLTTEGQNVLIKAATIETEGAVLQTFVQQNQVMPGIPGRHGGHIKLQAESLRGTLHVIMVGEHGGMGETMFSTPKDFRLLNLNGQKGGNSGLLEVEIKDQSKGGVTYKLLAGRGGEGSEVWSICILDKYCKPSLMRPKGENGTEGVAQQPIGIK